jgi:DNA-binding response OmpR family regulator
VRTISPPPRGSRAVSWSRPFSWTRKIRTPSAIENAGRVYSREQLLDKVWGYDYAGETRTVDVHMHALRQAMEAIPAEPVALQTVRGIGYVLRRPA